MGIFKGRRKRIIKILGGLLLVFCIAIVGAKTVRANYLISEVSKSVRLLPIYKVDTPDNTVSISFDASWGAENTQEILDILDSHQVKTTFFLVNIWLEDYPEMAKEISDRGHEIGLHSTTHPHFSQLSPGQMEEELKSNFSLIKDITGQSPVLFRPPFGDYNNQVIKTCQDLNFQPIQWSIDSLDWKDLSVEDIKKRVLKNISSGDIVLFHNNGKNTAKALDSILTELKSKGLTILPIGELLLKGDWYIDYNGVQKAKN